MRDVIQKIVATETEAKRIVEEARAEADRILSDARKKAQDITARAYQEAGAEANNIVAVAVAAAEKEKEESLARAVEKIESQLGIDESGRKRVVEGIIQCVCQP